MRSGKRAKEKAADSGLRKNEAVKKRRANKPEKQAYQIKFHI
jgi:hypothetical protein